MAKWRQLWINIKSSFWFVPAIVIAILLSAAYFVIKVERIYGKYTTGEDVGFIGFSYEGIQTFLATIAGSMMTLSGVVFSITLLVLSQTAGQYTSRVLRNFMKNRTNQIVLGMFVGIFLVCLFLLANVHPVHNAIAAGAGFSLAIVGVGYLIYFIHHTSTSIQNYEIIKEIVQDTNASIAKLYPLEEEEQEEEPLSEVPFFQFLILSTKTGYIESIDYYVLFQFAIEHNTQVQLLKKIGDYVSIEEPICSCRDSFEEEGLRTTLARSFSIGTYRTAELDPSYGVEQLVDIALKGLSPGINDLATAKIAIDALGSVFMQLVHRTYGRSVWCENGEPRLYLFQMTFEFFLSIGFAPILEYTLENQLIARSIISVLNKIKYSVKNEKRIENINKYLSKVEEKYKENGLFFD